MLQAFAEQYGFSSYAFVDADHQGMSNPYVVMTNPPAWDRDYRSEGFLDVDPVVQHAKRSNVPFTWDSVPLPEKKGVRVPKAIKLMNAAQDHGFTNGIVVPFHYVDHLGRTYSSVCTFFWKSKIAELKAIFSLDRHDLHIVVLYWAQRVVDLMSEEATRSARFFNANGRLASDITLTDREREVLLWAARGKTTAETATILSISEATATVHTKNAIAKLGTPTKTSACVRAIYLRLIDP